MKIRFLVITLILISVFFYGCNNGNNKNMVVQHKIDSNWTFNEVGKNEWLPATVPGTVHTDLLVNKKIDDPFYRLNEHDLQWIDKVDWEYKTLFTIDKKTLDRDKVELVFKGLDTYADVFVNGKKILSADNMFREWKVDVKKALKVGENEMHIVFRSPIKEGIKKYDAQGYKIPTSENDLAEIGKVEGDKRVSIYTRKAGYHYGWDWGPRLVTSGIWRPVCLNAWDKAQITDLQIIQNQVSKDKATFTAVFEIDAVNDNEANISIANDGVVLASTKVNLKKGVGKYPVDFKIDNPKLWWTNGLGEANLYTISGELKIDEQKSIKNTRIGIRTLEFVREKDDKGTSFYFKLNGHPVFMKGANYIPNDMFLPRVTKEKYRKIIETAKSSNMNMLRVWGGGVYEDNYFYDLCDENGILVWQDFMFACSMYPGDDAFLENIKHEAVDNVKRLRNHPSIALWCGNNEILDGWNSWGYKQEAEKENAAGEIWEAYVNIFHKILPGVVAKYDSKRGYWSSSPSSGQGKVADYINGDAHYYGVWYGQKPFEDYNTNIARFMSEYGFESYPEITTIEKFALPEDYDIYSDVMKSHQRSSIGNKTIENYMQQEYNKPKDFESFLYVNQVLQANGIKIAIEAHRRAMPFCMGTLYWQINDVWPVASWSSTDYYQNWKALQYYVKKEYSPVLVSIHEDERDFRVDIINDRLSSINAKLRLRLMDFKGKVIWENTSSVDIPANSSNKYFDIDKAKFRHKYEKQLLNSVFTTELIENGVVLTKNNYYFAPFRKLKVPHPKVEYRILKNDTGYSITLKSNSLGKNIYLQIGDEEGFFSDNYFDLLPGEEVTINLKTKVSESKLKKVLTIRTLDDAF